MTPFNPMRPFVCRNGCVARLIGFAKDVDNGLAERLGRPLVVAVSVSIDGSETVFTYHSDGTLWGNGRESEFDLVNIAAGVKLLVRYFNIYEQEVALVHSTRKEADEKAALNRIACIKVSYTSGQFDE